MWVGRRPRNCFSALCCRAPASSCPLDCEGRYLSSTRQSLPALLRPIPIPRPPPFPLGYSGGTSVPTRSPGALVLPLRPSCPSHPSPRQTTSKPPSSPKSLGPPARPPSKVLHHSHTPSHQTGPAAAQQRSRVAERQAESAAGRAEQSTTLLLLITCVGCYMRYGTHRQSSPALQPLDGAGKQVNHSVRPPVIWVIRSANQSTAQSSSNRSVH